MGTARIILPWVIPYTTRQRIAAGGEGGPTSASSQFVLMEQWLHGGEAYRPLPGVALWAHATTGEAPDVRQNHSQPP